MRIKGLIGGGVLGLAIFGATGRAEEMPLRPTTTRAAATRPDVPALVSGQSSFIVRGLMWMADEHGLWFEIASDPAAGERITLVDAADGTPIFLSDGSRTLMYDLDKERVVLVPNSRGNVSLMWRPGETHPTAFTFGIRDHSKEAKELKDPKSIDRDRSSIRLESFPQAARAEGGRLLVAAKDGAKDGQYALEVVADGFHFTRRPADIWWPDIELDAANVGRPVPPIRLAFPDLNRLRASGVNVVEMAPADIPAFLKLGIGYLQKCGLAVGEAARKAFVPATLTPDWDALHERDKKFGAIYRDALSEQGIVFPTPAK